MVQLATICVATALALLLVGRCRCRSLLQTRYGYHCIPNGTERGCCSRVSRTNHRHQLVPTSAPTQYGNGQPVLDNHLTHYRAYIAYTQQRPFNQEKLLSWAIGR